jgi:hypothetical protein
LIISRGQDLRVEDPYQDFRIPTIGDDWDPGDCQVYPDVNLAIPDTSCPGLDLGITFDQYEMESITGSNQDFHLRTWLRDPNTGQVVTDSNEIPISRLLGAEDRYISAQDVYTASNGLFHWDRAAGRYAPQRIALLSFTGEFPLAGSYGLLQMKYFTAISKLHWGGVSPPCAPATAPLDPTGLYDTPCNLENGGGSLQLGTQMVMKEFARHFSPMPSIDGVGTFETDFTQAYQEYDPGQPGYGTNVIRLSNSYLPVAATTIFALGVQQ